MIYAGYKLKFVFLVEGKHDRPIVSEAIIKKHKTTQIEKFCIFYNNDGKTKTKYGQESDKLEKLLEQDSPYEYLIKYEGGKGDLLKLVKYVVEQLLNDINYDAIDTEIYLMTDLDGDSFPQKFKKMRNEILKEYEGADLKISSIGKSPEFYINKSFARYSVNITLFPSGISKRLKVHFIFIDPTLEHVVSRDRNINKNKVNEKSVREFAKGHINELAELFFS